MTNKIVYDKFQNPTVYYKKKTGTDWYDYTFVKKSKK